MDVVTTKQRKSKDPLEKILNDVQLVESAVSGDHAARERLAVAALPRVRKLVYFAYGNRPDHEDLVQIAMVTIFKDLPGLRDCARFRAWMDTVVYNVVRAYGRKRMRFAAHFTTMEVSDDSRSWDITPEDENMGDELATMLQRQLDKIAPKKRTAAVMSIFFGYVDSEVAQMMGCSVETAKKRIRFGRKELLEKVQRELSPH